MYDRASSILPIRRESAKFSGDFGHSKTLSTRLCSSRDADLICKDDIEGVGLRRNKRSEVWADMDLDVMATTRQRVQRGHRFDGRDQPSTSRGMGTDALGAIDLKIFHPGVNSAFIFHDCKPYHIVFLLLTLYFYIHFSVSNCNICKFLYYQGEDFQLHVVTRLEP